MIVGNESRQNQKTDCCGIAGVVSSEGFDARYVYDGGGGNDVMLWCGVVWLVTRFLGECRCLTSLTLSLAHSL